ncbi:hypothetical protein PT040_01490 [Erysipelothrix rhusiopathiae]|nr:hypothetical protein [Erysipelothrix rhusiopathiae]
MVSLKNEVASFASYSLFRKLNDSMTTQEIIIQFVEFVVVDNYKKTREEVQVYEVKNYLEEEFGFKIPYSIISQAMRKSDLLTRVKKDVYSIKLEHEGTPTDGRIKSLKTKIDDEVYQNNLFIESIFDYIESKEEALLSEHDKLEVISSIYSFLLEKNISDSFQKNKYYKYISTYLIGPTSSSYFKQIESIKEGSLLLVGLSYNDSASQQKKWVKKFDIYIETEVLFHLAGFNGKIFQEIAEDTFSLIEQVNKKKKVIHLKIFDSTIEEYRNYFDMAIQILESGGQIKSDKQAMTSILENCETQVDVLDKLFNFEQMIEKLDIESQANIDVSEDIDYNLSSAERLKMYCIDNHKELDRLTFINRIRKGVLISSLVDAKAIILTEKRKLSDASTSIIDEYAQENKKRNNLEYDPNFIPYHINLWLLSARLWYDLDKGFGNSLPKSISIISKAQVVLSSQLTGVLSKEYEKAVSDFNNGLLTEEEAIKKAAFYKRYNRNPDDIVSCEVEDYLNILSEDLIDSEVQKLYDQESQIKMARSDIEELTKKSEEQSFLNKELIDVNSNLTCSNEQLSSKLDMHTDFSRKLWEKEIKSCKAFQKCSMFAFHFIFFFIVFGVLLYIKSINGGEFFKLFKDYIWILGFFGLSVGLNVALKNIIERMSDRLYSFRYNRIDIDLRETYENPKE